MTARTKSVIKSYFQRGLKPTQQQYEDLIDSYQDASSLGNPLESTSSSSATIGTGTKGFTTEADKQFDAGTWILIYSSASPTNYMHGQSTSYSGTSLSINVTNTGGSGTYSDWVISVSGTQGPAGATGPQGPAGSGSGDVIGPGTTVDSEVVLYNGVTGTSIKRASGTGYIKVSSGVYQTPSATIPLTDLATQAANTILANATSSAAAPTAVAIAASQLVGRGSTGDIAPITVGTGLSLTGTTLSASTGSGTVTSITAGNGLSGGTITSSGTVAIDTNNSGGIGAYAILRYNVTSTLANGATASGSNLRFMYWNNAGTLTDSGLSPSGTWRNVSGTDLGSLAGTGLFIRTA